MTIVDMIWSGFLGGFIVSFIFWILEVKKDPIRSRKYLIMMFVCALAMNLISLGKAFT